MTTAIETTPRVYVLAPVHNRRLITEHMIRCLLNQTYTNWHLVLIDDGSTDGTSEMASQFVPSLTILRGKGNWWWAGSLQQGYRWLKKNGVMSDDVILILNDDTDFDAEFIAQGLAALRPQGLLLAQLYSRQAGFIESGVRWDWEELSCKSAKDLEQVNCFSTRGLFHRFDDMLKIGGFRPWLMPHYFSDYEYTMRAHRKGIALLSSPEVRLFYDEASTGIRSHEQGAFWTVMRRYFSMRAVANPIFFSIFILLACPRRYVPINLWRVFKDFCRTVAKAFVESRSDSARASRG
jgi:GT2 family glycosyltransferase